MFTHIDLSQYAKYAISRFFLKNRQIVRLRFFISLDLIFMFYGVFLATRNIFRKKLDGFSQARASFLSVPIEGVNDTIWVL